MGKTPAQKAYSVKWRKIERGRKRHNTFIVEYTKLKFWNVYNEANCFFTALDSLYPEKLDLRRTKEFKDWKKAVTNTSNSEINIITQVLQTDQDLINNEQNTDESSINVQTLPTNPENLTNNEQNTDESSINVQTLSTNPENLINNEQNTDESSINVQTLSTNAENLTNNDRPQSGNESDDEQNTYQSDTDMNQSDTDMDQSDTEQNHEYSDNMLLRIPLENYLLPDKQDKNTQTASNNRPETVEAPSNNDYDIESFSDQRLQEIMNELRASPELRNLFDEPAENLSDQEDEGIELPTIMEELEVDIEPFDYRLEVELSNWESHV